MVTGYRTLTRNLSEIALAGGLRDRLGKVTTAGEAKKEAAPMDKKKGVGDDKAMRDSNIDQQIEGA